MSERPTVELREAVLESLRMVIDPELGENLVDLGLIYRVDMEGSGNVRVNMSTTTKGCPAASFLRDAVYSAVFLVPGVTSAEVLLVYEPAWSPEMISDAVKHKFGASKGTVR